MSEGRFRLSHLDSTDHNGEQGEEQGLREDLKARTSELQLRRPSRRELRLQREANEAKAAEQSTKRSEQFASNPVVAPTERQSSGRVHTFSLSSLDRNALRELMSKETKPTPSGNAWAPTADKSNSHAAGLASTFNASDKREETEDASSSGRSSLFDRFGEKDNKDSVSFRDRLVARTREGQKEAREIQPVAPTPSADTPDVRAENPARFLDRSSNVQPEPSTPSVKSNRFAELLGDYKKRVDEVPANNNAFRVEESAPTPEVVDKAEETRRIDAIKDTVIARTDEAEDKTVVIDKVSAKASTPVASSGGFSKDSAPVVSSADSSKDADSVVAVAEDGRYPTDVSMRLSDSDEEKPGGDRLVSALIILIGILAGVVVGLVVQKVIFGAEGIDVNPVYSVQAAAQNYLIGS